MSKNRIGFQLVDLQNKNLTSGATVTIHGLFNVITKAEGKPCVITGLRIGNKHRNDEVVTFIKDGNTYIGAISDGILEITSNSVKYTTVTPVSVLSEAVQTLNTEVATLNTVKANNTSLGEVELTNTATTAHTVGTYFIWGGQFVKATTDIAIDDTITDEGVGANVEGTTIATILTELNSSLFNNELTDKLSVVSSTTIINSDVQKIGNHVHINAQCDSASIQEFYALQITDNSLYPKHQTSVSAVYVANGTYYPAGGFVYINGRIFVTQKSVTDYSGSFFISADYFV